MKNKPIREVSKTENQQSNFYSVNYQRYEALIKLLKSSSTLISIINGLGSDKLSYRGDFSCE